ncbi:barstar family protein [Silvibacterium sp.]|uniref:barstar family protein n=1 Tax=Silvibacterium sp. TaxID=1964179 RepID=UPI0039E39697
MIVSSVVIDCASIADWGSFHDCFAGAFGFPGFYGRNMDAWIDCMTSLDSSEDEMSTIHCASGSVLTLQLENVTGFRERCPEIYDALIDCAAFVNWRKLEVGESAVLALSFRRQS